MTDEIPNFSNLHKSLNREKLDLLSRAKIIKGNIKMPQTFVQTIVISLIAPSFSLIGSYLIKKM